MEDLLNGVPSDATGVHTEHLPDSYRLALPFVDLPSLIIDGMSCRMHPVAQSTFGRRIAWFPLGGGKCDRCSARPNVRGFIGNAIVT